MAVKGWLNARKGYYGTLPQKSKDDPDPQATLEKTESLIAKSPTNVPAHQMLGDAARALGILKTTAFAFETIHKIQPKDLNNIKNLANVYIELDIRRRH